MSFRPGPGTSTSGTDVSSIVDAAGDLLVGTADNTLGRLAKGTVGKVLQAQSGGLAYGTAKNGNIGPSDHGLIAWSFDPALTASTGFTFVSGASRVVSVSVPYATTITNIHTIITTAGAGLTSGQTFACLYSSAGPSSARRPISRPRGPALARR